MKQYGGSCAGTDTSTVRRHIFNLRTKIGAEDTDEYDIVSGLWEGIIFLPAGKCLFFFTFLNIRIYLLQYT